eukprot:g17612.t1
MVERLYLVREFVRGGASSFLAVFRGCTRSAIPGGWRTGGCWMGMGMVLGNGVQSLRRGGRSAAKLFVQQTVQSGGCRRHLLITVVTRSDACKCG